MRASTIIISAVTFTMVFASLSVLFDASLQRGLDLIMICGLGLVGIFAQLTIRRERPDL